jgi:hypothetical protein
MIVSLVCGAFPLSIYAQESAVVPQQIAEPTVQPIAEPVSPPAAPQITETATSRQNFISTFAIDQKRLWQSPLKIKRGDVKWLAPLSVGAVALLATDHKISDRFQNKESVRKVSGAISNLGGGGPLLAMSAGIYGIGKISGSSRATETSKMAAQAVLQSELLVRGLKTIMNRERPSKTDGQGQFWGGGRSFPSGHAATTWSFATVVAHQYRDKPLISIGAYGLATAVSLSRISGRNHFPSDVLIGASIGHLIGRYIIHRHAHE